jgi:hypothetical protein
VIARSFPLNYSKIKNTQSRGYYYGVYYMTFLVSF